MENFPGSPKYDAKHWANELGNFSYHTENPYQIDIPNNIQRTRNQALWAWFQNSRYGG